jgi:penicillin-binding protein 2
VSGKTGSAQRVSNDLRKSGKLEKGELEDNGWFVAFAPRENPEIVIAVFLEGGEHGNLAAPTARDVIKAYFDKKVRLSKLTQPTLALIQRPGDKGGQAILSPVTSTSIATSSSEDH